MPTLVTARAEFHARLHSSPVKIQASWSGFLLKEGVYLSGKGSHSHMHWRYMDAHHWLRFIVADIPVFTVDEQLIAKLVTALHQCPIVPIRLDVEFPLYTVTLEI